MKINGAELIIKIIEKHGIKCIAGMPGGNNLPLYDALSHSEIEHVLIKHEQAAGFIAQGIARTTGQAGVCFATSGPGATNLITAIADAQLDSIPMIAITGQVTTALLGTDAFQEVDTFGMTAPISKHNYIVKDAEELAKIIPEAFHIATSGRPGPVVIDIPKDIQLQIIEIDEIPSPVIERSRNDNHINKPQLERIAEEINKSQRPIFFIGGGIIHSEASKELIKMAEKNNIPVVSSLMGLGAIPCNHPLYAGMLGMHGLKHTNRIVSKSDLLIAIGTRFGDRATGNVKAFCKDAKIIHIDIDSSEINKIKRVDYALQADAKKALNKCLPLVENNKRAEWIKYISEEKTKQPTPPQQDMNPIKIIKEISSMIDEDSIIVTDVGQHQMWTAQHYNFKQPKTFLTSGGLGTMGFGLPAAMGAAIANPDKNIICITGDGSILMNIQEFATLADMELNIKVIILNNQHLGLVRQQQELFYKNNCMASKFDNQYDFAQIGTAFGINSSKINNKNEYEDNFQKEISSKGARIIDIHISEAHNVLPIVKPGKSNTEIIE